MKNLFAWSEWRIATKILVTFLGLSVVSLGVIAFVAITNIRGLGAYALETSADLGESAIQDSTSHLVKLGEETITQIARHVAKQIDIYLETRPPMSLEEMRNDSKLREIAVQPVGTSGYTTILDSGKSLIVIHKFPGQEKDLSPLKDTLPSFWTLLSASENRVECAGYYDWLEVDGTINEKYAAIVPISSATGDRLTLWATTYIDEFSQPVEDTKKAISADILNSSNYINNNVSNMQKVFIIVFALLMVIIVGLSLLLSKVITRPITALKLGAEAIGQGNLDYKLNVNTRDELGDLADSFNDMGSALKTYTEELKKTAEDNIIKERRIQENLRLYVQKVSQAQEAERKRIARELHDDTAQSLVVVSRHLEDLASGETNFSPKEIREEVRKILDGVRKFSQELRPSILDDLGLVPAVKWLASDLTDHYRINVEIEIRGEPSQLSPESELILFRIVQEALTNVRKHSGATSVHLRMEFIEHAVKVIVQDNGKGFSSPSRVEDFTRTGRLGITGMQERAQLLGGNLAIDSAPGKGTILTVEVPT